MTGLVVILILLVSTVDLDAGTTRGRIQKIPAQRLPTHQAPLVSWGVVILQVVEGARIYIDGQFKGQTPLTERGITLTPGTYSIEVKKKGYKPWAKKVEVPEDGEIPLTVSLQRRTGTVIIRTNVGGTEVFVDGALVDAARLGEGLSLPLGKHIIRITKSGYRPWEKRVEVQEDKEVSLTASLEEKPEEPRFRKGPRVDPRDEDDVFIMPSF